MAALNRFALQNKAINFKNLCITYFDINEETTVQQILEMIQCLETVLLTVVEGHAASVNGTDEAKRVGIIRYYDTLKEKALGISEIK